MKIVVLAGGTSTERNVSIVSGTKVCEALRSKGHEAILVDVYFGVEQVDLEHAFPAVYDVEEAAAVIRSYNDQLKQALSEQRDLIGPGVMELCRAADVVFLALHGANGEDGKIQAMFDLYHIPYTGAGYLASAMAMDKAITKKLFRENGIPTPHSVELVRGKSSLELSDYDMEFPVVVKTCCGGSSVGVYIVHNQEEYKQALEGVFSYEDQILIEEYIEGREFSVGVVDGKAYPVIEIAPIEGFYDYKNKYSAGATVETCPADLDEETTRNMQSCAEAGCRALCIEGYARLDFMMKEDGDFYCLEANTLPGMTPTSLLPQEAVALGIDYPSLCEELIRISLRQRKNV